MKMDNIQSYSDLFFDSYFQLNLDHRYGHLINEPEKLECLHDLFVGFMMNETVARLILDLKRHDETSFLHSFDVMLLAGAISFDFKSSYFNFTYMQGALLHDIGKLLVPAYILQKNGKPTDDEFQQIKYHTLYGHNILKNEGLIQEAELARAHHERIDGRGYPDQLVDEELSFQVKLLSAIDVYSALTLERPYKKAFSNETAFDIMLNDHGHYDAEVLEGFILKLSKDILVR